MDHTDDPYLVKARESLAGAESELAAGRSNNAANRAYYAAFQAAIDALIRAGYSRQTWTHKEVQALFAGQLVTRRKMYSTELRSALPELGTIRNRGDYRSDGVTMGVATRAVRLARSLLGEVDRNNA